MPRINWPSFYDCRTCAIWQRGGDSAVIGTTALLGVLARFAWKYALRTGLQTPGVDEVIQDWPGRAGDLGDGVPGDVEPQEVMDFSLPAVEA